jgi:predicted 3-demethylubiquinone-9 3-methyltransferase (glyoxalase superfamily)
MNNLITPCIWFNDSARQAAELYGEAFGEFAIESENPFLVVFSLRGERFWGLNGGPKYKPNPSISLFARLDSGEEVDRVAAVLADGGTFLMAPGEYPWSARYAWLEDRFGVSWQLYFGEDETTRRFSPTMMFTGEHAGRAEDAIAFYSAVFDDSATFSLARYEPGEGDVAGTIKHGIFRLGGNLMRAMDSSAAHGFAFNEGLSLVISCDTQQEIDHYWSRLTADGGSEGQCGWLKDKFGVSWQVIPSILAGLMNNPETAPRVGGAFMKMRKFNIAELEEAAK